MKFNAVFWICCIIFLITGCDSNGEHLRSQLAELELRNRTDELMTNDTLAEALVDYFDKNGTPNECLRANYILGRTYADLGELPLALETYLKAADQADTSAIDCNYKVLSRVHAQKADIYYEQIQPRSQLRELQVAEALA